MYNTYITFARSGLNISPVRATSMDAAFCLCRGRKSLIECHSFCSSPCKIPYYKKSDPASLLVFYAYATGGDSRSSTYFPSSCAKYKISPFSLLRDGFSGLEVAFLCAKYKTLLEFVLRAFDMKCVPYSLSSATQTNPTIRLCRNPFPALCPIFLCATCMNAAIGLCRGRPLWNKLQKSFADQLQHSPINPPSEIPLPVLSEAEIRNYRNTFSVHR